MSAWRRVVQVVGVGRAKVAAVAIVGLFAVAGLASLGAQLLTNTAGTGITDYPTLAKRAGDADLDGLPDVLENRLGSNPNVRDTLGHGVPDGWVYQWYRGATDWNDTHFLDQPALVPPSEDLPKALQVPGALKLPTVADLYHTESTGHPDGAWWADAQPVDPLNWDNDHDGIADAWLIAHGLRPWEAKADAPAPGDPSFTLREKYNLGLDPTTTDSDHDGLSDRAEVSGTATFAGREVQFKPTDPLRASTRDDGVPDGFVVRFGLDPHDDKIADTAPTVGGLTVREAYEETLRDCTKVVATCDWAKRLNEGPLVDPTGWDSNHDGVPDAWVVRESHGTLSALDDARTMVLDDTTAWDQHAWAGNPDAPSVVVDDANPQPKVPFKATLADYYARSRPLAWNETTMGPWWGGIPSDLKSPPGALPPAVALRGWNITVDPCRGCRDEASRAAQRITLPANSDPRLADSDGDGIPDIQEYLGWDGQKSVPRTNPFDSDTDGDGLSDLQERALGTNPLRRDTSGGFLTDGEAYAYWSARYAKAVQDANDHPDQAAITYHFLQDPNVPLGTHLSATELEKLKPDGMLDGKTPNILNPDVDGDGIPNGAELLPNTYLDLPTTQERPATDPARADSDGDGLPDAWEIGWSRMRYFVDCPKTFCVGPNPNFQGWPLNPARYDSFDPTATELAHGPNSDATRNLKGDLVHVSPTETREFSNFLAYKYGGMKGLVSPFEPDSSPADGIPDMFAIQWGIEGLPQHVKDLAETDGQFAWVKAAGSDIEGRRPAGTGDAVRYAVMDPARALPQVGLDTNLLGMFYGREKGTWVFDPCPVATGSPPCTPVNDSPCVTTLPGAGDPRAESGYDDHIVDRHLTATCFRWIAYPLGSDLRNGTDPWKNDFTDSGLPDAWRLHYGLKDVRGDQVMPSSIYRGCEDATALRALPPAPTGFYCLTYAQAYANGLDPTFDAAHPSPFTGDTDHGGLADWYEIALRDGPSHANLDPLNKLDDHGEEDWDGDGLLNRVEQQLGSNLLSPDTDHDGLLDGDLQGIEPTPFLALNNGNGNLCLRTGSDLIQPRPDGTGGMAHRPGFLGPRDPGGPMTHDQLLAWYRSLGLLMEPNSRSCPNDGQTWFLVKREGMLDRFSPQNPQPVMLGAGGGTDSTKWDTTGEGVPDGWAVYWRDRAGESQSVRTALDPTRPGLAQSNPDGDIPTLDEYRWGRPSGWNESNDGPWWGGLDPTQRDTNGNAAWFRSVFNGYDGADPDADADGLPLGVDPYPGIDHANADLIVPEAPLDNADAFVGHGHVRAHGYASGIHAVPGGWAGTLESDLGSLAVTGSGAAPVQDGDWVEATGHVVAGPTLQVLAAQAVQQAPPPTGYATDYTRLWDALDARPTWAAADRDHDGVPDAIDRARVTVTATAKVGSQPLTGLSKADQTAFTVTGKVTLAESARASSYTLANPPGDPNAFANAASGAVPVGGATVRVEVCAVDLATDACGSGPVATVGADVTRADGTYTVNAVLQSVVSATHSLSAPAVVAGKLYDGGLPSIATGIDAIAPGPVKVWAMVEPNDPVLQPLSFGGKPAAQAYKDVAAGERNPTAIPGLLPGTGTPLRAALAKADGTPDLDTGYVEHAAEAVFASHSDQVGVDLRAKGKLTLAVPGNPSRGQPFAVTGTLTDAAGVPLPGRQVQLTVGPGGGAYSPSLTVAQDGSFGATFATSGLPVGALTVVAHAQLDTAGADKFLDPPADIRRDVTLTQATAWEGASLRVNGLPLPDGAETPIDPEFTVSVDGTLRELPGNLAVAGRTVHATLGTGGTNVLAARDGTTDGNGHVHIELPALPDTTPEAKLELHLDAVGVTDADTPAHATFFVDPLFPTRLTVLDGEGGLGERVLLRGHLERYLGSHAANVTGVQGSIEATFQGQTLWANATDEHGNFTIGVRSLIPAANGWAFRFLPAAGRLLQASPVASARALHTAPTTLRLLDGAGTVGQPVSVSGRLAWDPADVGVYGQVVRVGWTGGDLVPTLTDPNGLFHATLPARGATGPATLVMAFDGSPSFGPVRQEADVAIREPTRISLDLPDVVIDPSGATADRILVHLADAGAALPGREVHVLLRAAGGANRTVDSLTGSGGDAEVRVQDLGLDRPGAWIVEARYDGSGTEQPVSALGVMAVTLRVQLVVDRLPAAAYPGDRVLLAGRLLMANHAPDAVPFEASLDGALATSGAATEAVPWSLAVQVPADAKPGDHELTLAGSAPGIALEPVQITLAVRTAVQAVLDVASSPDGSRAVAVHFVDGSGDPVQRGLHVVLIRQGTDGRVLGVHELETGDDGTATLRLAPDQAGNVTVLQVNDHTLAVDSLAVTARALQPGPGSAGMPAWLLWTISVLAILVAGAAALAYRSWRRTTDQGLEAILQQARRSLADPTISTAEVIRRAYAGLLEVLQKAGYTPRDSDTVRTITATVESAFRLPPTPWRTVSGLFETAAYSRAAFGPSDRHAAQQAFGALAHWWSARLHPASAAPAAPPGGRA